MIKKNFILQEVIDELIKPEISLVTPLMKLNYFGHLTKNQELIDFTTKEINGYKHDYSNIPFYRKTIGKLIVEAKAYMTQHTVEVPISMLEKPFNDLFRYIDVREGIEAIEKMRMDMIESSNHKGELYRPIPISVLKIIQPALRKVYSSDVRLDAVSAKLVGDKNIVIEIPNYIRTKLLEFVMEIASNFGYDIEIESFNNKQNNTQTINNIMNTIINTTGDGNVVNTGDQNKIHSNITINKGDLEKLATSLNNQGIDEDDIKEISEIVQNESPSVENRLGERANNWILKIVEKSLKGIGRIATGVSSSLLASLIKAYYGIG